MGAQLLLYKQWPPTQESSLSGKLRLWQSLVMSQKQHLHHFLQITHHFKPCSENSCSHLFTIPGAEAAAGLKGNLLGAAVLVAIGDGSLLCRKLPVNFRRWTTVVLWAASGC